MSINIDGIISLGDARVHAFLLDKGADSITLQPTVPVGFVNDVEDRRDGTGSVMEGVEYLIDEVWSIEQKGSSTGVIKVTISLHQILSIDIGYYLFLRKDAPNSAKSHAKKLLNEYDPAVHGDNVHVWVNQNLGPDLHPSMFVLDSAIRITKKGGPVEKNVTQRDAFLAFYQGSGSNELRSEVHLIGDMPLSRWAEDYKIKVRKIGEEYHNSDVPLQTQERREVPPGEADIHIDGILNEILKVVVPSQCGDLRTERLKLLSIGGWPEFMIKWETKQVKIACSTISITYPVLMTRFSSLVFYVFFSMPRDLGRTVFKIAETCAIRSALGGSVIGVILGNPGAAQSTELKSL